MPWVKLDDSFYSNPVNRSLGSVGRDTFIASLTHCNRGLTDGRIAKGDVPLVLAMAQAKPAVVAKLVDAGRWIDRGDHYEIDGYLAFQPSREKVLAEREAAKERMARARQRRSPDRSPERAGGTSHRTSPVGSPAPTRPVPAPPQGPGDGTPVGDVRIDLEHPETPHIDPEQQSSNVTAIRQIRNEHRPEPA